jgi:hypothetical protein
VTRWARVIAGIVVVVLAAVAARALWTVCARDPGLPLWDEAGHGLAGVEVAEAIRHARPIELLLAINRQTLWPFVHSLMLAPFFLALGDGYRTAQQSSAVFYGAWVVALFLAGSQLDRSRGAWIGTAAAVLALVSPGARLHGTLAMTEVPGALLLTLAIAAHARSLAPPPLAPAIGIRANTEDAGRWLVAAGVLSTALFLCKYNFGLLWLVPLAITEWRVAPLEPKARLRGAIMEWVRSIVRRPLRLFMAIYCVGLFAILATGGGVFSIAGRRVSVRSPGNAAYVFYLLVLVWMLRRAPEWRRRMRDNPILVPARWRVLLGTVALPLAVWFVIPFPNRVKEFFGFVVNRESAPAGSFVDALLEYPRVFAHDYSPTPITGWIVLLLALIPVAALVRWAASRHGHADRGPGATTATRLATWIGILAITVHRYHNPRFLFPVLSVLWLCAALSAAAILAVLLDRPITARIREVAWSGSLALVLVWGVLRSPSDSEILALRRPFRTPAAMSPVLDRVLELAERASGRRTLLGYSAPLSPGLLAWQARLHDPPLSPAIVPARLRWVREGAPDPEITARLADLRRSSDWVIGVLPTPGGPAWSPSYRSEVWADSVTIERLAADPTVVRETEESPPGYRVCAFRMRGGGPGPGPASTSSNSPSGGPTP